MAFSISLYLALAIFVIGLIYKIGIWFTLKTGAESEAIPTGKRISSAFKGMCLTIFSAKILALIKIFVVDVIFQRKVFTEDRFRWLIHILIYGGFMFLLFMHALDTLITARLYETYVSSVNPFLFLRDFFGVLVIIGVALATYRRFILKAPRLTTTPMDTYALIILAVIMLSGISLEGAKIGSYIRYRQMVEEYAGLEEGEEDYKALTAFWVCEFGTVAPDLKEPFDRELIEAGRELHEMSCAGCHSKPQWGFSGFLVAKATKGIALPIDRASIPTLLWHIHFLACFIGLAYLPFSKFFHTIVSPLSLLVNSVMDRESDPSNIATRQALEFDACMHCGNCTKRCSVGVIVEKIPNSTILPSEKLLALSHYARGKVPGEKLRALIEGTYLCTNCHRCTEVCPAGINLEELWLAMRERLIAGDTPLFLTLSPLSYYRGLNKERIAPDHYSQPLLKAREAIQAPLALIKDEAVPLTLTPGNRELQGRLLGSDQASSFAACFGCQTCTNVCPVVAACENPVEVLGMLPHQIMYAAGLGVKDLALGSNMLWDCLTCYQCQEQCPQGVKVTEVLYELKNLAIDSTKER